MSEVVKRRNGTRITVAALVMVVGAAALAASIIGASPRSWQPDEVLEVHWIEVKADGEGWDVALSWPRPGVSVDEYEVLRDGDVVAMADGGVTSTIVDGPRADGEATNYRLRALAGGSEVALLDGPVLTTTSQTWQCSVTWTGAASSAWEDDRNWAHVYLGGFPGLSLPAGASGPVSPDATPVALDAPTGARNDTPGASLAARNARSAPDGFDDACIEARHRLPVVATDPAEQVGSLRAPAGTTEITLLVDGGVLEVTGSFDAQRVRISDGTLSLRSGGTVQASSGVNLDLQGGTLQMGAPLVVTRENTGGVQQGEVRVSQPDGVVLEGGELITDLFRVGPPVGAATDTQITGRNGHVLTADQFLVNGSLDMPTEVGGATVRARLFDVERRGGGGSSTVDWAVGGTDGASGPQRISVENTTQLTLADLETLGTDDETIDDTLLRLRGPLYLGEPVRSIAHMELIGEPAALYPAGGSEPNAGVARVDWLSMINADTTFEDGLATDRLSLFRSDTAVKGALTGATTPAIDLALEDSTLRLGEPLVLVPGSDLYLWPAPSTIVGDVYLDTELGLDVGGGEFNEEFGSLTIDGDLTVGPSGIVRVLQGSSDLDVTGALAFEGDARLLAELPEAPRPGEPLELVAAGSVVGSTDVVGLSGPGAENAVAVFWTDGVFAVDRDDDPVDPVDPIDPVDPECLTSPPSVLGVAVTGCWNDLGEGRYLADLTLAPDDQLPRIGGMVFEPSAGAALLLDLAAPDGPTLRSVLTADANQLGTATVTVPLRMGGDAGSSLTGRSSSGGPEIELGTFAINWNLAAANVVGQMGDLLGLPVPAGVIVAIEDGAWTLDVSVLLPDLIGALPAGLSIPVTGAGIAPEDLRLENLGNLALAELGELSDVALTWLTDETWRLVSKVGDPFAIDGTLTYDGGLDAGTVTVTGLTVGGMGFPDAAMTLTFDRAAGTWSGMYEAADGGRYVTELTFAESQLVAGSVELGGVELGVATIEDFTLTYDGTGWQVSGDVDYISGTAQVTGALQVTGGRLTSFELQMLGSFGPLGRFEPLSLAYGPVEELFPEDKDLPEGSVGYSVEGTVHAGGETSTLDGALVLNDGHLVLAQLDVDLALGELAAISGTLGYDLRKGPVWVLEGRDGAESATLTCGGTTSSLVGTLTLAGGTPTDGSLQADGVCFGPTELRQLRLEVATDGGGTTFDASATLAGASGDDVEVTGTVRLADGRLVEGALDLPAFAVGGLVEVPAVRLEVSRTGGVERWRVETDEGSLRLLDLSFTDGALVAGELWISRPRDGVAPVGGLGEWISLEELRLVYDGTAGRWEVTGSLTEPDVEIEGELEWVSGRLISGALTVEGAEIGPIATLDLTLTVDAVLEGRFGLSASVHLDGRDQPVSGSGQLVADGGQLVSGHLTISELPVGELATLADVRAEFELGGQWALSGSVVDTEDPDNKDGNPFSGSLTFDDGFLEAAELGIGRLSLGPASVHDLTLSLARTQGDANRTGTWAVSGVVDSPATTPPDKSLTAGEAEPVVGSLTMVDGTITELSVTVPYLAFGGLAYLEDLELGYELDDPSVGTDGDKDRDEEEEETEPPVATLSGSGTLTTAADIEPTAVSLSARFQGGRIIDASVQADGLPLGGLLTLRNLEALTQRDGGPVTCAGLSSPVPVPDPERPDLRVWAVSATVGPDNTSVSGCLGIEDGTLVAASLQLGAVQITELLRLQGITAVYDGLEQVEIFDVDGKPVTLDRTRLALSADVVRTSIDDDGEPTPVRTEVSGSLTLIDGGLESLSIELGSLPLIGGVQLTDLALHYEQAGRYDGVSDTSFSLTGTATHGGGTTTVSGQFTFAPAGDGGQVTSAFIGIDELPLGPFAIDTLALTYESDDDGFSWGMGGSVTVADGETFIISGDATVEGGRLVSASAQLPRLPIYDQLQLADLSLSYAYDDDTGGARWFGAGEVLLPGRGGAAPPAASVDLTLDGQGRLVEGEITAESLAWAGLFSLDDFRLAVGGDREEGSDDEGPLVWDLTATVAVADGPPGTVAGSMEIADGRVEAGSITITDVGVAGLVWIDELSIEAVLRDGLTEWIGTVAATSGGTQVEGDAELRWEEGSLVAANLELGEVPLSQGLTLEAFELAFPGPDDELESWSVGGAIRHEQGTSSLGGSLAFFDGRVLAGSLEASGVRLGPLELNQFSLAATPGEVSACDTTVGPAPDRTNYALSAQIGYGDGRTSSAGGYLSVTDGRVTQGGLCGNGIRIAELALIDDVNLAFSAATAADPVERWSGGATVRRPSGNDASASLEFGLQGRQLQSLSLEAAGIRLGGLLELRQVEIGYDRSDHATNWSLAATLAKPGATGSTVAGTLQVDRGMITAGSIDVANLPLGDLVTLNEFSIEYVGRRSAQTLPQEAESASFALAGTPSCGATPSGFNVPSGAPTTAGSESYFAVSASVDYRGDTYAARGSVGFDEGRLTAFDVTAACLPLGDLVRLEDVRIALNQQGSFRLGGRMGIDDRPDLTFYGNMTFNEGRLTGGGLKLGGVPLGVAVLDLLEFQLGQNPDGTTTWGAGLSLSDSQGNSYGGSGAITLDEGRIVAGQLTIGSFPLMDLLTVTNLSVSFSETPGGMRLAGSGGVRRPASSLPSTLSFSIDMDDGRLVGGSLAAENLVFFNALPIQSFSLGFSPTGGWSGSIGTALDSIPGAPGLAIGVDVADGRIVGGMFGFDSTGNGQPDPPSASGQAPLSGNGAMANFPLKALFVSFCPSGSTAAFCDGGPGNVWKGALAVELPTPQSPAIAGSITIRNGRLVGASIGVTGLNVPVFSGVFLNSVGAAFSRDPQLEMSGTIGAKVGPSPSTPFMELTGTIQFNERPAWTAASGVPYESYQAEYLQFVLLANAEFFGIPVTGSAYIDIQTRGYAAMGGSLNASFIGGAVQFWGAVHAAVFNSAAIGATNPDTGEPMTGIGFQASAELGASLLGASVSAQILVNNVGVGACATTNGGKSVGGGFFWARPLRSARLRCDMGRYTIVEAVSEFAGSSTTLGRTDLPISHVFDVEPGEELLGVQLFSEEGNPDYLLASPDGTLYEEPTTGFFEGKDDYLLHRAEQIQWFAIEDPVPGTWRLAPRPGSANADEVGISSALPDVEIGSSVSVLGDRVAIDVDVKPIEGQEVAFFEKMKDPEDPFMAPIGGVKADGRSPAARDAGESVTERLVFTPSGDAAASEREIVAVVLQDGLPRSEHVVGSFTAPAAGLAAPPTVLSVTEVDGGAQVSWAPPADDGGRQILSYQVLSGTGLTVAVEPDVFEATLQIPSMEPGKEVPVIVRAFTGAGPGEGAVTTFVASQTTGLQYLDDSLPGPLPEEPPVEEPPVEEPPVEEPPLEEPPVEEPPVEEPLVEDPTAEDPTVVVPVTDGEAPLALAPSGAAGAGLPSSGDDVVMRAATAPLPRTGTDLSLWLVPLGLFLVVAGAGLRTAVRLRGKVG